MTYTLNGLQIQAGDIICNADGTETSINGIVWKMIGSLVPGEVSHIAIYMGPGPQFIEAGPYGVQMFEMPDGRWDSEAMKQNRGFLDTLVGIVSPYSGMGLSQAGENELRQQIIAYCMKQVGKPYNFDFFNPETEEKFYCSQLAYKAFLPYGINLHTGAGVPPFPDLSKAILPQEIWAGYQGKKQAISVKEAER